MPRPRVLLVGIGLAVLVAGVLAVLLRGPQTFEVQGRVAAVEDCGHTLVVEHEQIPGYMPPMTMPLSVADSTLTTGLEPDDAIQFQLAVSGDSSWIADVSTISDTAVARHPARKVRAAPQSGAGPHMLQEGDTLPADVTLTNQAGESIRMEGFRGQALVLTFIYTRCPLPDYCPLMSKRFASLQPTLREQFGSQVHLLSISFDPAYDTPTVLREYAARYTDRFDTWTFATGDTTQVQRVTGLFGVFTKAKGGEIIHNLTTAVVGPDGTVRHIFRGNDWQPEDVLRSVKQTLN